MIRLTFLGTGTSQGVPMIACPCEVCRSTDPRDRRLRTSALIQVSGIDLKTGKSGDKGTNLSGGDHGGHIGLKEQLPTLNIVIDAGPDFRSQMLSADVTRLDAILLTHEHKDHTGGIDDVRAYNYFTGRPVDIYATERVQKALRKDYDYAFDDHPYPGAPEIALHTIADDSDVFTVKSVADPSVGIEVIPIRGRHMMLPVTGFRIGPVAYLTDFNRIDDSELAKLQGLDTLVVNALGHKPHISHFNLDQAIELSRKVGARHTLLTHIAHRMGLYADIDPSLPEGVHLAYDGLTITV